MDECLGVGVVDVAPQGVHDAEHIGTETYVIIHLASEEAALLALIALGVPLLGTSPRLLRLPDPPAEVEGLSEGRRPVLEGQLERGVVGEPGALGELARETAFVGEGVAFARAGTLAAAVLVLVEELSCWCDHCHGCG